MPGGIKLTLPKYTSVANPRLNKYYALSMFFTFVLISTIVFISEGYLAPDAISTRMSMEFDRDMWEGVLEANASSAPSVKTSQLCPQGAISGVGDCISEEEAFVEKSANELFLVTSWQVGNGHINSPRALSFIKPARVTLKYSMQVTVSPENRANPWYLFETPSSELSNSDMVTTQLMSSRADGRVLKEFRGGEPLTMTMPEIFAAARGNRHAHAPSWGDKELAEELLMSGAEITASVSCHQTVRRRLEGPVCKLVFEWLSVKGKQMQMNSVGEANLVLRRYFGFRFRTEQGYGESLQVCLSRLTGLISTAIVYMMLPKSFFHFFICNCLGHMSNIYKRAIVDPFDAVKDCSHVALRLLSASVQFVDLAQLGDSKGITRSVVADRIQRILEHRGSVLAESEVDAVINFVYKELCKEEEADRIKQSIIHGGIDCFKSGASSCCNKGAKLLHMQKKAQKSLVRQNSLAAEEGGDSECAQEWKCSRTSSSLGQSIDHISIDTFSAACASNDKITFNDIVDLFDVERPRSRLERYFTPPSLVQAVHDANKDGHGVNLTKKPNRSESLEVRKKQQWDAVEKMDTLTADYTETKMAVREAQSSLDSVSQMHQGLHSKVEQNVHEVNQHLQNQQDEFARSGKDTEQQWLDKLETMAESLKAVEKKADHSIQEVTFLKGVTPSKSVLGPLDNVTNKLPKPDVDMEAIALNSAPLWGRQGSTGQQGMDNDFVQAAELASKIPSSPSGQIDQRYKMFLRSLEVLAKHVEVQHEALFQMNVKLANQVRTMAKSSEELQREHEELKGFLAHRATTDVSVSVSASASASSGGVKDGGQGWGPRMAGQQCQTAVSMGDGGPRMGAKDGGQGCSDRCCPISSIKCDDSGNSEKFRSK